MKRFAPILLAIGVLWSTASQALDLEQRSAEAILQRMCARCHAVGRTGASPNELAPPSARTKSMIPVSCSAFKMATAAFIAPCRRLDSAVTTPKQW